ncbi:hypothetical protein PC128_g22861 [Phytophthora cactorum]|nr:hypothetical protein PC128_g22861 [Phytophthora cactorum]
MAFKVDFAALDCSTVDVNITPSSLACCFGSECDVRGAVIGDSDAECSNSEYSTQASPPPPPWSKPFPPSALSRSLPPPLSSLRGPPVPVTSSTARCTSLLPDEGGWRDAMFKLEAGATLKNVIIGKNQREGVHCDDHDCTLENVWWEDVCEDALSVKGGTADSVTNVLACGAKGAEDKIIQHNGYGHVNINGFYAENFGKLYRSCGTCGDIKRTVYLNHVWGNNPENALVTVNSNNGDVATFTDDIHVHSDEGNDDIVICKTTAATDGDEPEVTSTGVSKNCVYDADAIEYY